jgi:hypothetical protein
MIEIVTEVPEIGEQAILPRRALVVSLRWDADVELDIMALYVAKDGRTGGVFSKVYPMGDSGNLEAFPFMQIADGRLTGLESPNEEHLLIATLEPMREVHIAAFSYTDMALDRSAILAHYNVRVIVRSHGVFTHEVPLACMDPGHLAVVCKLSGSESRGTALTNVSEVLDLEAFRRPQRERHYGGW